MSTFSLICKNIVKKKNSINTNNTSLFIYQCVLMILIKIILNLKFVVNSKVWFPVMQFLEYSQFR